MLLFVLLFLHGADTRAGQAELSGLSVAESDGSLALSLGLTGAITPEMREGVLSGIPLTFSFTISLSAPRGLWFNKTLADIEVLHTIKYDTLRKEYTVTRTPGRPFVTHSREEAENALCRVENLPLAPLALLAKGKSYHIKARAGMDEMKIPEDFRYVLFFKSNWEFDTGWTTIDFYY
jgi:hypothetical protein